MISPPPHSVHEKHTSLRHQPLTPPLFRQFGESRFFAQHLCGFTTPPHKAARWIYVGDRCYAHVPAPSEHPSSLSGRALLATGTLRCAHFSASMNISPSRACAEFRPVLGLQGLHLFILTFGDGFPARNPALIMLTVRYMRSKRRAPAQ